MDTNDTLDLYGVQEMMTITAKDYNFMPLSSRMGTIKDFKDTDISYIYDARMLIAEPHAEETGDMKVDLEVKAEPSLFDEEEVETIEPVKKKEVKKKKEKTKFEPISFDDLLKDDNF